MMVIMCLSYVKVKNRTSSFVVNSAFFPCGKCADCRKNERLAWTSRMRTHFLDLKRKGWNLGFLTLTYNEECLPHIPDECFTNPLEIRSISCFNRLHIRQWIKDVRQYFKYHNGFKDEKRISYFVCSEYGTNTHRPHYHAILAWPSEVNYEKFHAVCRDCWKYGFVGPRYYYGDSHCGPFEIVGEPTRTLSYVAKYVSKDVDFLNEINGLDFYYPPTAYEEESTERQKAKTFVNCLPVHIQSVSLGFDSLRDLEDYEKYRLLIDGFEFVGDDKRSCVSLYVKRKLLFDNYYVIQDGNRLVRRKPTLMFERFYPEIFDEKSKYYDKRVNQMCASFLEQSGVENETVKMFSEALDFYWSVANDRCLFDLRRDAGRIYLAYGHIDLDRCYDIPMALQWFNRYRVPEEVEKQCKDENWQLVDNSVYFAQTLFDVIDCGYKYVNLVKLSDRDGREKLKKRILDFYNNVLR